MKNRTNKMTLMKVFPFLVFIATLFSCGTTKEISSPKNTNYSIVNLNIVENGFEGNIVVEVYDNQMNPLNDYQSVLTENGEVIFDVPQKGHRCTFFEDGKSVTIEIKKEGYKTVKTKPFSTDVEMELANFIKITLEKE